MDAIRKKTMLFIFTAVLISASILSAWSFPPPINFPEGWRPNPGATAGKIEYRIIDDPASAYKGKKHVYLKGHFMTDDTIDVAAGDRINVSFYVKDTAGKTVSAYLYAYSRNKYGGLTYISTIKILSQKAGAKWSEVKGSITIPETFQDKRVNGIKVVMASGTGANFDYPHVEHIRTTQWLNYQDAYYEGTRKAVKGDYKNALDDFRSALKLAVTEKEKEDALKKVADTEYRVNLENAGTAMEEIFARADDYIKKGSYDEARREYEKLKGLEGIDFSGYIALCNIAESYRMEKDYKNAHRIFRELLRLPDLKRYPYYRIYGMFRQAETYAEDKDYRNARSLYDAITKRDEALEQHVLTARILSADTYLSEKRYSTARKLYEALLKEEESSEFPHESQRHDLIGRLESIEGLRDGQEFKSRQEKLLERLNSPGQSIYVSMDGKDTNPGTKEFPFATIRRAQEEIRKIKSGKGLPRGGIAIYLRGGRYFLNEGIILQEKDSGTEESPVVYRGYPGEEARIIGGRQIENFKQLADPDILQKLPEESRGRVWVCDLKKEDITDYGKLQNRGHSHSLSDTGAMELFFNTKPMRLVRWPKEGWLRVSDMVTPEGDGKVRSYVIQKGSFRYSDARPERWKDEKDIWTAGYFLWQWDKIHTKVVSVDTENKIIKMAPDIRHHKSYPSYDMPVRTDAPYYLYNILSELSVPEEFYIDRDNGSLYFYPPDKMAGSEIIVSTLDAPVIEMKQASNIILFGLSIECTWRNAIEINGGSSNLIAGTMVRNTGVLGIEINGGWNNGVVGCNIYDTGEGGIRIKEGGDRAKLIPSGNYVENNHIYRFNRFSHGGNKFGITIANGTGNRVSHNLLSDASYIAMTFAGNDNIIEYNEIYDVVNEGRDGGAIYTYGAPRYLMSRGNVMRYNFIHNINEHSSPIKTHQVTGLYIDALNSGMTMEGNIFYRNTERAMYAHGPDNRIENNLFVENNVGISMADRSWLLDESRLSTLLIRSEEFFREFNYKQPPWSARYPRLAKVFEDRLPLGRTEKNNIERNVNAEGPFFTAHAVIKMEKNVMRNNWDEGTPLLVNPDKLDFRMRPGSPVYGATGHMPIPFKDIGVYRDPLRASWPVNRLPAGKYYKKEMISQPIPVSSANLFQPLKKVSETYQYNVIRRNAPVNIDGKLQKSEWSGMDKTRALFVGEHHITGERRDGAESYAWLSYDDNYLYIGIENSPDPVKPGVPAALSAPSPLNEIAIEGVLNQNTVSWWNDGLPTGPIYIFTGYSDGRLVINKKFNIPDAAVKQLEAEIEYKSEIIDPKEYHWTAEWKIPLAALELEVNNINLLRFNIGTPKRGGWYAWVATGSSIWRIDNAGFLKFIK